MFDKEQSHTIRSWKIFSRLGQLFFMVRIALCLVFPFFIATVVPAQSPKETVKVTDLLKIKSLSGVTLSKDGSKAAFTVTDINPEGYSKWDYKYINHIYIAPTD